MELSKLGLIMVLKWFHSNLSWFVNKTKVSCVEVLYVIEDIQTSNEIDLIRLVAGG